MNALQLKALQEAVRLIDTIPSRGFFPENYSTLEAASLASKKHNECVYTDAHIRTEAKAWIQAALDSNEKPAQS